MPATTPSSFRGVSASWRVMASVRKKVKIGDVELRMVARPASSERSPQASMVQGITLLRQAWNRKRRQVAASVGIRMPRQRMITSSSSPAISGARSDQGDRRNGRDADLDEAVGRAPQRRERQQQRQFEGDVGLMLVGFVHVAVPFSIAEDGSYRSAMNSSLRNEYVQPACPAIHDFIATTEAWMPHLARSGLRAFAAPHDASRAPRSTDRADLEHFAVIAGLEGNAELTAGSVFRHHRGHRDDLLTSGCRRARSSRSAACRA